jgi:hypothetical protein
MKLLAMKYKDTLRNKVTIFYFKEINCPVKYRYTGIYRGLFNYLSEHYTFLPLTTFPEYS